MYANASRERYSDECTSEAPTTTPLLDEILKRIALQLDRVAGTSESVKVVANRVFGFEPEKSGPGMNAASPAPSDMTSQILNKMDALDGELSELRRQVQRLGAL